MLTRSFQVFLGISCNDLAKIFHGNPSSEEDIFKFDLCFYFVVSSEVLLPLLSNFMYTSKVHFTKISPVSKLQRRM